MADRRICTHNTPYARRKIIPDWEWLDEKIPQCCPQAAWGVRPAGQEENKTSWAAIGGRAGGTDSQRTWTEIVCMEEQNKKACKD